MNRRQFFNLTIPATGAVMLAPGCLNRRALEEINQQFSGKSDFDQYDLIINGAGLAGYFAAIHAAKKGKRVLVVEKRTSPGYEIAAKKKLWLGAEGFDKLPGELIELFLPEGEKGEIQSSGGTGQNSSLFEDEILLFSGSVRKGMLRNLLVNKVHVLLMTDVCGLFSDGEQVQGVLLACKHGIYAVKCRSFIDASDNVLFSRELLGDQYRIKSAGFVAEILQSKSPRKKEVKVSSAFGLKDDILSFHNGKNANSQMFIEFGFPVNTQKPEEIEHQARLILAGLGRELHGIDETLKGARIHEYAVECSIHLEDEKLPAPIFKGHYVFSHPHKELNCTNIIDIQNAVRVFVDRIKYVRQGAGIKSLVIPGASIPLSGITLMDVDEPGLSLPLKKCTFDYETSIKNGQQCQVLAAGGGTSGAMAAIGSCEKGSDTIVVDYFNDLGGTKTMGGVMGYYHGVKDHTFLQQQESDSKRIASGANMNMKAGRKIYHLEALLNGGGRFISGAIICGTLVKNKLVQGIVICRNGNLEIIRAGITIDSTGDGDIAFFAGASYRHGNTRTGKTQNYSQWDISGGGKSPTSITRDYDIIDNTRISELQRGLFLSHYEAHFYDFHPMLSVRESRRIEGLNTPDLIDAVEGTHFEDIISRASSDFDPHYVGISEYSRCGFLLPHSNILTVEIPYRAIVPKNLQGILISGKAISQSQNHLQFTRMSADLIVLGYLTGQIAADIVKKGVQPADYDISPIQQEWYRSGYFPPDYLKKKPGNRIQEQTEMNMRVKRLAEGNREYLYECVRLPKDKAIPLLLDLFNRQSTGEAGKLLLAKALAWFGEDAGNDFIEKELNELFDQEMIEGYPGGYIENYDFIRGREKNVLEGLFWRINQNIGLLAMSGNPESKGTIKRILENTTSGGEMFKWTGDRAEYFNERIDIRLIPFHNRILNLCFYAERLPETTFIPGFEKLLTDENISGYLTEEYHLTRWRVYGGDLELFISAALARCGGKTGYDLLSEYLKDIHFNFKNFAVSELKLLTKKDFGFDSMAWNDYISGLTYPQPSVRLEKDIEL